MPFNLRFAIVTAVTLLFAATTANSADSKSRWAVEFEKGCEKGQFTDCLNLATGYTRGEFKGKTVEKNPTLGKQYLDRAIEVGNSACRQGNLKTCYQIGVMHFEGMLVPTDFAKGIEYARKACVGGYKEACDWLKSSGVQ